MKKILLHSALLMVCCAAIIGCKKTLKAEPFSESKPYSVEIKQERGYYQAERIVSRLNNLGLPAYILEREGDDGVWYRIMSGALADSAEVANYVHMIDSTLHLRPTAVLDYNSLDSLDREPVRKTEVVEKKRIDANNPSVPREINDVIAKYPDNNMFYLQKISLFSLTEQGIKCTKGHTIDMPRGVSTRYLQKKGCTAMAVVIYEDNLYGDRFTLQVVRCRDQLITQAASLIPVTTERNEATVNLCSEIADMILETGVYKDEQKEAFDAEASSHLSGYKVSFVSKKERRVYYIFTDESGEHIYMAQSTKEDDKEILDFLSGIGKGEGLPDYSEFFNTFYTMPDQLGEDVFLGYYVDRLRNSYARERGYKTWAKRMVGHWDAACYFYNPDKGVWNAEIFDLLTDKASEEIYGTLYRQSLSNDARRTIYGVDGAAIYQYNWWTGRSVLSEINLGCDRYVLAITGSDNYSEQDLIDRAERMQFIRGGYKE